ncbi:hypothetical protein THII_2058 [Thioploca ingrica]|uniref:Uncharacterized protein n=1 Tax=Thioploca ingrica TaxID=40754 RepID=A0A090AMC9_9GAMM|nr:hypothetical protein THII_2058 [Thioploca ingrica]
MWQDPIIEEIHKIRLEIETDCHCNFDEIFYQAVQAHKQFLLQEPIIMIPNQASIDKSIDEESLRGVIG